MAHAQRFWPESLRALSAPLTQAKIDNGLVAMVKGELDVLVLPYFHMTWAAAVWPCYGGLELPRSPWQPWQPWACPKQVKQEISEISSEIKNYGFLDIIEKDLFMAVRIRSEFAGPENRKKLLIEILDQLEYPIVVSPGQKFIEYILETGWHRVEEGHVWSKEEATVNILTPPSCEQKDCSVVLRFVVYGASRSVPKDVSFSLESSEDIQRKWLGVIESESQQSVELSLDRTKRIQRISIKVPEAISPFNLGKSSDPRTLGIALLSLSIGDPSE